MPARAREGYLEMKALAVLLALAAPLALAAEEAVRLDSAPIDPRDVASLQSGARSFVNYCLNCHSAGMMRYHKLLDLGLTEQQVKDNLLFTADKIGELMNVAMTRKDAKEWLGTAPPDLSVIARARGPDWLYTYMRSFYRDPESATGWNNMVFERVAMPHVLWTLSGQQVQVERKFKNMEQAEGIGRQQKNAWKIDVLTPDQAGKEGERSAPAPFSSAHRSEFGDKVSKHDESLLRNHLPVLAALPHRAVRKGHGLSNHRRGHVQQAGRHCGDEPLQPAAGAGRARPDPLRSEHHQRVHRRALSPPAAHARGSGDARACAVIPVPVRSGAFFPHRGARKRQPEATGPRSPARCRPAHADGAGIHQAKVHAGRRVLDARRGDQPAFVATRLLRRDLAQGGRASHEVRRAS